jgi:hypothetical protein
LASRGETLKGLGYWINPWWRETHTLDSEKRPDECRSLLIASSSSNLMLWLAKGIIRSQLPGSDVIVLWRRPTWLRNSFGTVAVVRCGAGGRGTTLHITLRSRYVVAGFVTFWLGFVVIFNLVNLYNSAGAVSFEQDFPLFMLAIGIGFLALGRLLARGEGPALLDFIRQTTGAQELGPELRPFC